MKGDGQRLGEDRLVRRHAVGDREDEGILDEMVRFGSKVMDMSDS